VNPLAGRSWPEGAENLNDSPLGRVNESIMGLNDNFPEKAMAVTIVGEARKFIVLLLPSFLDLKLRLKLVRMAVKISILARMMDKV
jgi:hypothetical protein